MHKLLMMLKAKLSSSFIKDKDIASDQLLKLIYLLKYGKQLLKSIDKGIKEIVSIGEVTYTMGVKALAEAARESGLEF